MTADMAIKQAQIDVDWLVGERPGRTVTPRDAVIAFDFGPLPVMERQAFWGVYLAAFTEHIKWWQSKQEATK